MSLPNTTTALRSFLAISLAVHAAVLGWRSSTALTIPEHLGLAFLSARLLPVPESDHENREARRAHARAELDNTSPRRRDGRSPAAAEPATPVTTSASQTVDDDQASELTEPAPASVNHLLGEMQTELSRYLTYPPLARKHGWEGEVVLRVTISQNGHLADVQLAQSSGYDVLDRAALKALARIERLPNLAGKADRQSLVLRLPIIYQLTGMRYGTPTLQDLHPDRRLRDHDAG